MSEAIIFEYPYNLFLMERLEFVLICQDELEAKIMRIFEHEMARMKENWQVRVEKALEAKKTPPKEPKVYWIQLSHNQIIARLYKYDSAKVGAKHPLSISKGTLRKALNSLIEKGFLVMRSKPGDEFNAPIYTLHRANVQHAIKGLPDDPFAIFSMGGVTKFESGGELQNLKVPPTKFESGDMQILEVPVSEFEGGELQNSEVFIDIEIESLEENKDTGEDNVDRVSGDTATAQSPETPALFAYQIVGYENCYYHEFCTSAQDRGCNDGLTFSIKPLSAVPVDAICDICYGKMHEPHQYPGTVTLTSVKTGIKRKTDPQLPAIRVTSSQQDLDPEKTVEREDNGNRQPFNITANFDTPPYPIANNGYSPSVTPVRVTPTTSSDPASQAAAPVERGYTNQPTQQGESIERRSDDHSDTSSHRPGRDILHPQRNDESTQGENGLLRGDDEGHRATPETGQVTPSQHTPPISVDPAPTGEQTQGGATDAGSPTGSESRAPDEQYATVEAWQAGREGYALTLTAQWETLGMPTRKQQYGNRFDRYRAAMLKKWDVAHLKPAIVHLPEPELTFEQQQRCKAWYQRFIDYRGYAWEGQGQVINERKYIKLLVVKYTDVQAAALHDYMFNRHFKWSKPDFKYKIGAYDVYTEAPSIIQILKAERNNGNGHANGQQKPTAIPTGTTEYGGKPRQDFTGAGAALRRARQG